MIIKTFGQLSKADVLEAGGKGASLGEMTQAGIPVPHGFVVLSSAFEKFLDETDLNVEIESILGKINHKEIRSVENASEQINALILNASMPENIASNVLKDFEKLGCKYVAVRSSATAEDSSAAAWAGQLESYLNTTEKELLKNVQRCWASLFTPRAIFYRFEKKLNKQKISVAVVVQKMVQSEVSGVAFSVHPVTQDYSQLIIEAGYGLGEAIVSGSITPDSYVVDKQVNEILDKNIADQKKALVRSHTGNEWKVTKNGNYQKLTDKQILSLAHLIIKIEKHYGFPCDIEWAFERSKFYVTQSRPITTLFPETLKKITLADELIRLSGNRKLMRIEGDFVPFLVMIDWLNFYDEKDNLRNIYPALFYFSKKRTVAYLTDLYKNCAEETFRKLLGKKMSLSRVAESYYKSAKKIENEYDRCFTSDVLSKKTEKESLNEYKNIYSELQALIARTLFIEQLDETIINAVLEEYKLNTKKLWDVLRIPHFPSFETRNKKAILQVLSQEKPLSYLNYVFLNYTFVPDNKYLSKVVKTYKQEVLTEEIEMLSAKHAAGLKKFNLEAGSISSFEKKAVRILDWVMFARDERRDYVNMAEMLLLRLAEKLYSSWGINPHLVRYTGMFEVMQGKKYVQRIIKEIERRRLGFGVLYKNDHSIGFAYEPIKEQILALDKLVLEQSHDSDDDRIKGEVGNRGKTRGKVRIILRRSEFNKFKDGEVLVTGMTRPEFVPLMKKCSAIITDEGGITSHAAIVSRELNKPCIIGTKIATQVLRDGDLVEVDGNKGVVKIVRSLRKTKVQSSVSSGFELEFTREIPISLYNIWYEGHLYAVKNILGLKDYPVEDTYAIFQEGVIKGYTPKNNVSNLKRAINKLSSKKLASVLESYAEGYKRLKGNSSVVKDKDFLTKTTAAFVITFILGDMEGNKLQKNALNLRIRTESYFYDILKALKLIAKDKNNMNFYSYDETIRGNVLGKSQIKERKHCQIIQKGIIKV